MRRSIKRCSRSDCASTGASAKRPGSWASAGRAAPEQLAAALQKMLAARLPQPSALPEPPPRVTIGQRIEQIRDAIARRGRVSFMWLAEDCETRGELIVTFLALLELYRKWEIGLEQDELFGEIWIAGAEGELRRG